MANKVTSIGTCPVDNLIASGNIQQMKKMITLKGTLKRGQIIAVSDAGAYSAIASGGNPFGILCDDLDSTGDANVLVYTSGHFNANALIGLEHTSEFELRKIGIHVDAAFEY